MSTTWELQVFDRDRFVPISASLKVGSGTAPGPWHGWEWHTEDAGPDGWEGYTTDDPALALRMIDAMIADGRSSTAWSEMWRGEVAELASRGIPLRFIASAT